MLGWEGGGGGGGGHKPSGETSLFDTPESVDAIVCEPTIKQSINCNMVYARYRQGMRSRRHEAKLSPSLVSRPHLSVAYHGTARSCLSLVIQHGGGGGGAFNYS